MSSRRGKTADFCVIKVRGDGRCGFTAITVAYSQVANVARYTTPGLMEDTVIPTLISGMFKESLEYSRKLMRSVAKWSAADKLSLPLCGKPSPVGGEGKKKEITRGEWLESQLRMERWAYAHASWSTKDNFSSAIREAADSSGFADSAAWLGSAALMIVSHILDVPIEVWIESKHGKLSRMIRVNGFGEDVEGGTTMNPMEISVIRLLFTGARRGDDPNHYSVLQTTEILDRLSSLSTDPRARQIVYNPKHCTPLADFFSSRR